MFEALIKKYYILGDVELNPGSGGAKIAVDTILGDSFEVVKQAFGSEGTATMVDAANPLPVTDALAETALAALVAGQQSNALTNAQLRATPVDVDTGLSQPLTDAQLRAVAVPVSGTFFQATQPVSGPLTDVQLRTTPVPVSISSGGGGAVTIADGADVAEGAVADAAVAAGAAGTISAKLRRATQGLEDLKTLIVLAAGSAIIGKVGIDQTTPGTTNAVQANAGTNLNTSLLALESGGNLAAIAASASVLDDWDESDRAKVNPVVGQAGVAGGSGVDAANVQRVSLATNVALPAGTNLLGKTGIDQTTPGTTNLVALSAETTKVIGTVNVSVPSTIFNGKTSVTTAGTRVVLAATQAVKSITIKALVANTGLIFVGNATVASTNGFQLSPGDSVSMDVADLNSVNIDSAVNGEGVSYIAIS